MASSAKFIPGSDADAEDIFKFPFFDDEETVQFIKNHGRIMFIVRGPPGTGKRTLTDMVLRYYSNGVCCSADDYFSKTFNSAVRTRESLKQSHDYCHTQVKQECTKGTHPVIVSNTHMKKFEMQEYLNYAAEYGYTIVMAITTDKFEVSPEILAKSNTKGLTKEYFEKRLKQWENVYPILTGWFLCLDDTSFVLKQLQSALDALLEDGKFCRVFNAFDREELFQSFKAKEMLFCIAGYSKNTSYELKDYYQSTKVKASYGKSFRITIEAFVVTVSDIIAIVQITGNLRQLIYEQNYEMDSYDEEKDDIVARFKSFSMQNAYNFKTIDLSKDFSKNPKTAVLEGRNSQVLNIKNCSLVHLAQKGEKAFSAQRIMHLFKNIFNGTNQSGDILDQFSEIKDGYQMSRLPKDAWLVKPPKNISVNTVFTGLYI